MKILIEKFEKNAGVKEEYTTGRTIIRLQKIDSSNPAKDKAFYGSALK